jgi:hypothetical protein
MATNHLLPPPAHASCKYAVPSKTRGFWAMQTRLLLGFRGAQPSDPVRFTYNAGAEVTVRAAVVVCSRLHTPTASPSAFAQHPDPAGMVEVWWVEKHMAYNALDLRPSRLRSDVDLQASAALDTYRNQQS